MKIKPPKDELSELLGTTDRKAQVDAVKRLKAAPIIDVLIRVDGRVDQVTGVHVLGGKIPPTVFYRILDQVRDQVREAELQAVAQNGKPAPPPAPEPPAPEEAN